MHRIFLSSCFADPEGERLHIRDRIIKMTGGSGSEAVARRPVWLAEDFPELRPTSPWGELEKTEFCLEGVRQAECFVAIVTKRHGSQISIDGVGSVPTSFFEAELFEAALLRKPSYIFLLEGFEPEGKLVHILKLLEPAFPGLNMRPLSEDQILRQIDHLITTYQRPRWLRTFSDPPRLSRMVDSLFWLRHRTYDAKSEPLPLRFLGQVADPSIERPDPDLVNAILDKASGDLQHQAKLTLVYFAIRALMGAAYDDSANRDFLPLWERAMTEWLRSAGWYGLHGHFLMSSLASLGSLSEIRMRLLAAGNSSDGLPHGGIGSAYYSIAKLASHHAPTLFDLALKHVNLGIEFDTKSSDGIFAVRGSIHLQTGRLEAALADYRRVVELRQANGGSSYGEALSELGYAQYLAGDKSEGIDNMLSGLDHLSQGAPSGFQVRAMRKLALAYARSWKFNAAIDLASHAHEMASEIGALDQIRFLEKTAQSINRLRNQR